MERVPSIGSKFLRPERNGHLCDRTVTPGLGMKPYHLGRGWRLARYSAEDSWFVVRGSKGSAEEVNAIGARGEDVG